MVSTLVTAVRERVSPVAVAGWVVLSATVYATTGELALIAGLATAFVVVEVFDVARSTTDVDERYLKAALGGAVTVVALVWLRSELAAGRDPWVATLALVGGVWVALDARADLVQGRRPTTDAADDPVEEVVTTMNHLNLVVESLQERPKTVPELAADCDLTASRVRAALETATDTGVVVPLDPDAETVRYTVDERRLGLSGVGSTIGDALRRLVRPVVDQF
jgi:hypothetical protein